MTRIEIERFRHSPIRYSLIRPLRSLDLPRLFRQHDRDAVADRIGEFCRTRDQFLLAPRRTPADPWSADRPEFPAIWDRRCLQGVRARMSCGWSPAGSFDPLAYSIETGSRAVIARRSASSSSSTAACRARGSGLFRQREAQKRPIEDLRAGPGHAGRQSVGLEHAFHIVQPAPVDRLHRRSRPGIDARPGADRVLQRRPAAERPPQQQRQRIGRVPDAASRLAMICSAATSRQCSRIAAWNAPISAKCQ